MAKTKKKLTSAQKQARKIAKAERREKFEFVFRHGKQVMVEREPTVNGIPVDEFIRENADPIWLHQNEMWELIPIEEPLSTTESSTKIRSKKQEIDCFDDIDPFA